MNFDHDPLTGLEAITMAQWLAFAPLAFQATAVMRDRGVLEVVAEGRTEGRSITEVAHASGLSIYAARVLLEAALGLQIVWRRDNRYFLGKLGHVLLNDEMTRVNFDFTRDICYDAAAHLGESLRDGMPVGLKALGLGSRSTLYQGLATLPEPANGSWNAFDHFYSDRAFAPVCERLAADPPARLLDVGCNAGQWARICLERFPDCEVGLVDLPLQLDRARTSLHGAGLLDRVQFYPVDLLDSESALPMGYELIWFSQFLDCFSEEQIVTILEKARAALPAGGRMWILELFWDRQRFQAAAFSLQLTSLYFTCVANGNSQMYDSSLFLQLVERAGFRVQTLVDGVGGYHTLLECRPAA